MMSKKLSEMIGVPSGDPSTRPNSAITILSTAVQASAGAMTTEPAATKKATSGKYGTNKKAHAGGQTKVSKPVEQEVVEGPIQPDSKQCGYYVMRFMKEILKGFEKNDFISLKSMVMDKT